jgi:hypothetical protein
MPKACILSFAALHFFSATYFMIAQHAMSTIPSLLRLANKIIHTVANDSGKVCDKTPSVVVGTRFDSIPPLWPIVDIAGGRTFLKNLFDPYRQYRKMRSITCRDTMSETLLVGYSFSAVTK